MQTFPDHLQPGGPPVLTIVVPSYNCGRFIRSALDSVVRQGTSVDDYEIVIVDNLSTDDTAEVLDGYQAANVRVIRERDQGQSDALNKGFSAAKGDWLCWLNADDEMVPGALPLVLDSLRMSNHANWLGGGMVWMDVAGNVIRCAPHMRIGYVMRAMGVANVGGPSSFFRRSLWNRAGLFSTDLHFCMDTDMWHRFQRLGEACLPIGSYVWGFRVHEASKTSHVVMTASRSPRMTAELERLRDTYLGPIARSAQPMVPLIWRASGVITGRDWRALRDTRRFAGRPLAVVAATECRPR